MVAHSSWRTCENELKRCIFAEIYLVREELCKSQNLLTQSARGNLTDLSSFSLV